MRPLVRLVLLLGWLCSSSAMAGYAQLVPPPAFQPVGPGVTTIPTANPANNFVYNVPPGRKAIVPSTPLQVNEYPFDNRAKYRAGFVGTRASLNVGTRTVAVPIALRVAGGAASFAVSAFNPWVAGAQLALLAIPFVMDWFSRNPDAGLSVVDGVIVKTPPDENMGAIFDVDKTKMADGRSAREMLLSMGFASSTVFYNPLVSGCTSADKYNSAKHFPRVIDATYVCGVSPPHRVWYMVHSSCNPVPGGNPLQGGYSDYPGNAGCMGLITGPGAVPYTPGAAPATAEDLNAMANTAIDPEVLAHLDVPLMVDDLPIVNPLGLPEGQVSFGDVNPAAELLPRPIRYPNGDPVLIPGTEPPLYTQPWYEVTAAPTADNPWRVLITHTETVTDDPTPQPDPDGTTPDPKPPFNFYTDCDKFPGSLGCASVGDAPGDEDIPTETRTISAQSGPTFAGAGCPANLNISALGHTFQVVDMSAMCGWISGLVKPIFMLLAFISAVFIVRSAL